jgi:hypothetical protein
MRQRFPLLLLLLLLLLLMVMQLACIRMRVVRMMVLIEVLVQGEFAESICEGGGQRG